MNNNLQIVCVWQKRWLLEYNNPKKQKYWAYPLNQDQKTKEHTFNIFD